MLTMLKKRILSFFRKQATPKTKTLIVVVINQFFNTLKDWDSLDHIRKKVRAARRQPDTLIIVIPLHNQSELYLNGLLEVNGGYKLMRYPKEVAELIVLNSGDVELVKFMGYSAEIVNLIEDIRSFPVHPPNFVVQRNCCYGEKGEEYQGLQGVTMLYK